MAFAQKESYIQRTFELAEKGYRSSGKNPCVGAVLVYENRIIGEGYYREYGGPHAEVNCIKSVNEVDKKHISKSTLYVSLEPCSIHGKTPPCANLIVRNKIPKVVISCTDPNPKIRGNGIKILQENGIEVELGILQNEGKQIINKFRVNILQNRTFVAMKWAQSKEGYAGKTHESVWYSNSYSQLLAHKLRSRFEAILVGSNTVNIDNPRLNNRLFQTSPDRIDPVKVIIDRNETCNKDAVIFHEGEDCIIYTLQVEYKNPNKSKCTIVVVNQEDFWLQIFSDLYTKGVSSVLIEGGPTLQKSIIKRDLWDEAHVLSSNIHQSEGIRAPRVTGALKNRLLLLDNSYDYIIHA